MAGRRSCELADPARSHFVGVIRRGGQIAVGLARNALKSTEKVVWRGITIGAESDPTPTPISIAYNKGLPLKFNEPFVWPIYILGIGSARKPPVNSLAFVVASHLRLSR